MKNLFFTLLIITIFGFESFSQSYKILLHSPDLKTIEKISNIVSIDRITNDTLIAFANEEEYDVFKALNITHNVENLHFKQQKKSKKVDGFVATKIDSIKNFTRYPSYQLYEEIMQNYATQNPDICKLITIGTTVENRKILALKISDNVEIDEANEPEFFYTSSMHGDEICGYVLMLRLINHIIKNYNIDQKITRLVNNCQLYINPLANPDGTFSGGDSVVNLATRYNANNVDLNRNFPSINKTLAKQTLQPETQAMIDFAEKRRFVMSANLHGGDEILNYPWDSFYDYEFPLVDEDFFVEICKNYVDTARKIDSKYMNTYISENGYIFGSQWYKVNGGRQDYMNFYHRCKEITIELSTQKILDTAKLENYWQKNYRSMINFANQCIQGVKGRVTDIYGNPLEETSIILDCQDNDYSHTFSRNSGFYFRPLPENKTYTVYAVADGYKTDSATITTVKDSMLTVNFVLQNGQSSNPICKTEEKSIAENCLTTFFNDGKIYVKSQNKIENCQVVTTCGRIVYQFSPNANNFEISTYNLSSGLYILRALSGGKKYTQKVFVK